MGSMRSFDVYEHRGKDDKHWIGEVRATSLDNATDNALEQYGSPIEVEEKKV